MQKLWPKLEVAPQDTRVAKNRYSALIGSSSKLQQHLQGIDTLLIAGTKTNVCCECTARDAMMLDYKVVMLSDCTAALFRRGAPRDAREHDPAVRRRADRRRDAQSSWQKRIDDMRKLLRALFAIALFITLSGGVVMYVVPSLTTKDISASLSRPAESRAPVLAFLRDGKPPSFVVTQLRHLDQVTGKYPGHSFLLPTGSDRTITDQDGDPATYTVTEVKSGRQRVQLTAMVGDYPYLVEYEAEDKKVFPVRAEYKDLKQGMLIAIIGLAISAFLTWLVMRLSAKRET
jgi:hypothetical protein